MGQRSLSACSWMRTIFSTVRRPQEPAFTVESLAMTATTRPPILPRPVITPSAGRSTSFALAKAPSSTKLSASSSMRTRSRANSFPVSAFFWWYFGAPPFSMRACSALALSSNPIAGALLAHPPVGGYTCPHAPPSGRGHDLRSTRRRLISRLPFPARLSTTLRLWKKNNFFFASPDRGCVARVVSPVGGGRRGLLPLYLPKQGAGTGIAWPWWRGSEPPNFTPDLRS